MTDIKFGNNLFYSQSWELLKKKVTTASQEAWDSLWLPDHLASIPGSAIDDFFCLWPVFGAFTELYSRHFKSNFNYFIITPIIH
jgi:hypothetical protein